MFADIVDTFADRAEKGDEGANFAGLLDFAMEHVRDLALHRAEWTGGDGAGIVKGICLFCALYVI